MVQIAADGGKVLFVGTKKQAQEVIQSEAERCGMWYVNQRWLGGTLTNFQTIRSRIDHMLDLQQKKAQGYYRQLPKKEAVKLDEKLVKLEKYFLGIKDMTSHPAAIFVIDIGLGGQQLWAGLGALQVSRPSSGSLVARMEQYYNGATVCQEPCRPAPPSALARAATAHPLFGRFAG